MNSEYMCCFCGNTITKQEKVLFLSFASSDEENSGTQSVFCHPLCFKRSMLPNVTSLLQLNPEQKEIEINIIVNKSGQIQTSIIDAIDLGNNRFLIEGNKYRFYKRNKNSEIWQFRPGDIVECYTRNMISGENKLLAFRKIESEIFNKDKWELWENNNKTNA